MGLVGDQHYLYTMDPHWSWLYNDKLWRGPMSPEHEKLFSLLAVLLRVVPAARRCSPTVLRGILEKIHATATREMCLEHHRHARISLRVRTAVEAILEKLSDPGTPSKSGLWHHREDYQAIEFVERAAKFGTRKSTLLTAVTDKTWQEQIAGRAQLALRRDWPELGDLR